MTYRTLYPVGEKNELNELNHLRYFNTILTDIIYTHMYIQSHIKTLPAMSTDRLAVGNEAECNWRVHCQLSMNTTIRSAKTEYTEKKFTKWMKTSEHLPIRSHFAAQIQCTNAHKPLNDVYTHVYLHSTLKYWVSKVPGQLWRTITSTNVDQFSYFFTIKFIRIYEGSSN